MDPDLFKYLAVCLAGVSCAALVYGLLPSQREREAHKRFEDAGEVALSDTSFLRFFRPFFRFFRPVVERLAPERHSRRISKQLVAAGLDRVLSVADFHALQCAMATLFFGCGLLLWKDALTAAPLLVAGLGYPLLWLWDRKKTRQRDISVDLPDMVDMLALSVEAGLDFLAGVKRISETQTEAKSPLVQELRYMYQNIKLGMSTEEALATMANRVDIPEMHSFTAILIQAQKMGSPITQVLKSQAERMRQQRFMKAERLGAAAAQKLLIPMMLCIFPILFLVIFSPYVLKFIYNG